MSAPDFDDFAALWTQEPNAEEERIFQSLARTVSRRAKLIYYIEIGLAFFLLVSLLSVMVVEKRLATAAPIILVAAALSWSVWKRYELQQVAMIVDCSDRRSLLSSAMATARGRLRQSTWSLILVPPVFCLTLALKFTRDGSLPISANDLWAFLGRPPMLAALAAILLLLAYVVQQIVRLRRELGRLHALQIEYDAEAALDAGIPSGKSSP
jgi:hypothetical protein